MMGMVDPSMWVFQAFSLIIAHDDFSTKVFSRIARP